MEQITLRIQSDVLESIESEAVEHGISLIEDPFPHNPGT